MEKPFHFGYTLGESKRIKKKKNYNNNSNSREMEIERERAKSGEKPTNRTFDDDKKIKVKIVHIRWYVEQQSK